MAVERAAVHAWLLGFAVWLLAPTGPRTYRLDWPEGTPVAALDPAARDESVQTIELETKRHYENQRKQARRNNEPFEEVTWGFAQEGESFATALVRLRDGFTPRERFWITFGLGALAAAGRRLRHRAGDD